MPVKKDTATRDEMAKRFISIIAEDIKQYQDALFKAINRNHETEKALGREYSRLDIAVKIRVRTDGIAFIYNSDIEWGYNHKEKHKGAGGHYDPHQMELFDKTVDVKPLNICKSYLPKDYKKRGKK